MVRGDFLDFVFAEPLQPWDLLYGPDEVLNGADGLEHEDLFRLQAKGIVLNGKALPIHCFLETLELRCQTLRLLRRVWHSGLAAATMSSGALSRCRLWKDQEWTVRLRHGLRGLPYVVRLYGSEPSLPIAQPSLDDLLHIGSGLVQHNSSK